MTFALLLAAAQAASPLIVTTPIITPHIAPPIIATAGDWKTEPVVARFVPGAATCGGVVQTALRREEPLPAGFSRLIRGAAPGAGPAPVALAFDVDASGRPTGIRAAGRPAMHYPVDSRDVAPALSLWRFQPGGARTGCRISFDVHAQPVATAPVPLLYRYLSLQRPGAPGFNSTVGRAMFARIAPAGSTCRGAAGNALEQHHPAFASIPQAPGTASFAFVGFDITAEGTTRNVRVIHSDGNAELDRQSVAALAKWRFAPGARSGCVYSYHRRQTDPVPAPEGGPLPDRAPARARTRCGAEPRWVGPLKPAFPPPFNRRSIEGWAVIGYDVAPWGATGNVRVIDSQPAEQFGEEAARVIRSATKPAGATGFTGCVQRVRFVMEPREGAPAAPEGD